MKLLKLLFSNYNFLFSLFSTTLFTLALVFYEEYTFVSGFYFVVFYLH